MNIDELIRYARSRNASDLHLSRDKNPIIRVHGELVEIEQNMTFRNQGTYA